MIQHEFQEYLIITIILSRGLEIRGGSTGVCRIYIEIEASIQKLGVNTYIVYQKEVNLKKVKQTA